MAEQPERDAATAYTIAPTRVTPAIEAGCHRSKALITVIGDWHEHPYTPGDPSEMNKKA